MPTRNVNLTDHLDKFVEKRVKTGQFSNASEVVREGLRLLEQRQREDEARLRWLRGAVKEGLDELDRGQGISFGSMDEFGSYLDRLGEDVAAEVGAERKRAK